jgi:hypothetical protein
MSREKWYGPGASVPRGRQSARKLPDGGCDFKREGSAKVVAIRGLGTLIPGFSNPLGALRPGAGAVREIAS